MSADRAKAQALLCECFGPFGPIRFPYHSMGKVDTLALFGLDTEMEIFALYWHHRLQWKRVLDIGANLGLHSILMSRLGWHVSAYEPDPAHFEHLVDNLVANNCVNVTPVCAAVHTSNGSANFVRVLNNQTGNHLEGYKASYGPRETIVVKTVDCRDLWSAFDFAKIDCEGNEAELAATMTIDDMRTFSCVMEVRNEANAKDIFEHFGAIDVPVWSQKREWARVTRLDDMPKLNREGSIYIGHRPPWD